MQFSGSFPLNDLLRQNMKVPKGVPLGRSKKCQKALYKVVKEKTPVKQHITKIDPFLTYFRSNMGLLKTSSF